MLTQKAAAHSGSIQGTEPLAGAYFWLLAFFVVYCARPEDWIPGLHQVPLAKITGIFALLAFALSVGQARRLPREVFYLFLLLAQLCLTVPFSPVWRGGAFNQVLEFSKVVVIVPVVVLAVSTLRRLRWLIFTQTASVLAVAVVSLVKGQLRLGRLQGALGGIYGNPNDLALAITLTTPFCFAFMLNARNWVRKLVWLFAMATMTYVVLLTGSRGGLLALFMSLGLCLIEFGLKDKRRYLLPLAGFLVIVALLIAGGVVKERFASIFTPSPTSENVRVARTSATQRENLLWKSIVVTIEHPLFGIGPANFTSISGNWHDPHNSYTQMSAEGGIPALVLYLIILRLAFANVRNTRRSPGVTGEELLLAGGLRASLAGYVVGSFFSSVAYHFFPYFLVAYSCTLYGIVERSKAERLDGSRTPGRSEMGGVIDSQESGVTWSDYRNGRALPVVR